ncbi:hypothetical protein H5410_059625 [Solanum commersonii]|uniref:Uncharacterized protein n=1 Tax=Solanum commersonii TaxID=4109 RepID=A0A9J5W2W4_SOLCO|nr:hypothetical protein H5410_059625 [Solanum commersonii]
MEVSEVLQFGVIHSITISKSSRICSTLIEVQSVDQPSDSLRLVCLTLRGGPVIWAWDFHVGGLKFETPCQRKQGVCLLGQARRTGLA